jgi:transposase
MRVDNDESYEPRTSDRGEVAAIVRVERRRRWSDEQKLAVLRETTEPGAIVSMVARRHGINTGQLYTWRKQLLQGAMSGFIPVDLTPAPTAPGPSHGAIRITGRTGLTVVVERVVDRAALKLVLGVIEELGH